MAMKIPNYGGGEHDRLPGYHPPACTCYDCNEGRRRQEEVRRKTEADARREAAIREAEEAVRKPAPAKTPAMARPARPRGLTISDYTHESVTLTWTDPGDNTITGYQILRRVRGPGQDFAPIVDDTGTTDTTYVDHTVVPKALYAYQVKAINAVGLSPQRHAANVDIPAAPTESSPPPAAPASPSSSQSAKAKTPPARRGQRQESRVFRVSRLIMATALRYALALHVATLAALAVYAIIQNGFTGVLPMLADAMDAYVGAWASGIEALRR